MRAQSPNETVVYTGISGVAASTSTTVSQAAIGGVLGDRGKLSEEAAQRGGPLVANNKEFMLLPMGKEGGHFSTMMQELLAADYPDITSETLPFVHEAIEKLKGAEAESELNVGTFGVDDRDHDYLYNFYEKWDRSYALQHAYLDYIDKIVKPLYGGEAILVQKTPNLRFNIPGSSAIGGKSDDPDGCIGLHCDSDPPQFHSCAETNYIVALTDMSGSSSLYVEKSSATVHLPFNEEYCENAVCPRSHCIAFAGSLLRHYNKENTTGKTRISLDFRCMPLAAYDPKSKYQLGKYYMIMGDQQSKLWPPPPPHQRF